MAMIADQLGVIAEGLIDLLASTNVVFAFMFLAMFIGTFAMFKGLLRFAFKKSGQFGNKEINVIAFMMSFIGTSGIFFMFAGSNTEQKQLILLFGGGIGLLLVLFITFFMLFFFYRVAENFAEGKGFLGKGYGWWTIMCFGVLLSLYLFLGYVTKLVTEGINIGLFSNLLEYLKNIIPWIITLTIIFGIMWLLFRGKSEDSKDEINTTEVEKKNEEKEKRVAQVETLLNDIDKEMNGAKKLFEEQNDSLNELDSLIKSMGGGP